MLKKKSHGINEKMRNKVNKWIDLELNAGYLPLGSLSLNATLYICLVKTDLYYFFENLT